MTNPKMTQTQELVVRLFRKGKTNAQISILSRQSPGAVSAMLSYVNKTHGLNLIRTQPIDYKSNNLLDWVPSKDPRYTVRGKSADGATHEVTSDSLEQAESTLAGMLA